MFWLRGSGFLVEMIRSIVTGFLNCTAVPVVLVLVIALASVGCRDSSRSGPESKTGTVVPDDADESVAEVGTALHFEDRSARSRIEFVYRNGEEAGEFSILESLGGGVGVLDYDRDGTLDLYFPGGGYFESRTVRGYPSALYRQTAPWRFEAVTAASGAGLSDVYTHGAAVADYDNDGFPDILVTGYGRLQLWHNLGDGTFEEVAMSAGLTDPLWSSSAGWGDLNGDGNLDLYVVHYVDWSFENHPHCEGPGEIPTDICPPRRFDGLPDTLYQSDGAGGFRDISREAGLEPEGKGLGVLLVDLDLNGTLDVYVCNDNVANFLYRNVGDVALEDMSMLSGTALGDEAAPTGSMGVDSGDLNLDGLPDIWVCNYEQERFALYSNLGDCFFQHASQAAGLAEVPSVYVGWGTAVIDFDADGDEDIFASNGHVIRFPMRSTVLQRPLLFQNERGKKLVSVGDQAGEYFQQSYNGRGAAAADLDEDGDVDLVCVPMNAPVALLANETSTGNSWLRVRLVGRQSNRDAIGATLFLELADSRQLRQLKGGASYASTSDLRLHFGLGSAQTVPRLEVRWPSGLVTEHENLAVNQVLTIVEPSRTR